MNEAIGKMSVEIARPLAENSEQAMNDNDKISNWMGKPCTCEHMSPGYSTRDGGDRYWGSCAAHSHGGESIPWDTDDSLAPELMKMLVVKKYMYELHGGGASHHLSVTEHLENYEFVPIWSDYKESISEAVSSAVLKLIEQEEV